MDDARIRQLAQEVLAEIQPAGTADTHGAGSTLEARVAALEAAVYRLGGTQAAPGAVPTTTVVMATSTHPSHGLLAVPGGGSGPCVLEPDKPCIGSGLCRTFGH
jgi:hypothetical protein